MGKYALLHAHSEYSLRDGCMSISQYLDRLEEVEADAAALTDTHNLFGAVKFHQRCQGRGIKPVIGADLRVIEHSEDSLAEKQNRRLRVLVENKKGYRSLCRLLSQSYRRRRPEGLWISLQELAENRDGLFFLGPPMRGAGKEFNPNSDALADKIRRCASLFEDRFFIEVPLYKSCAEDSKKLFAQARELEVPAVYTSPAYFPRPENYDRLSLRLAVQTNTPLKELPDIPEHRKEQWVCSRQTLAERAGEDLEPLRQAAELASRCYFEFETHQIRLPSYPGDENSEDLLRKKCLQQLQLAELAADQEEARKRLERELEVINKMGFADYFLIVADITGWARRSGIAVGPGRGSAAGSLVAYLLKITEVDPFQFDLIFERFLNEQRREMPDIDLDFPDRRREEVIDYIRRRFGEESVAHIITFGQLKARNSLRSIGRVRNESSEEIDRFLGLLPEGTSAPLRQLSRRNEQLEAALEKNSSWSEWFEQAVQLEGFVRNPSLHAAGILIAEGQLAEEIPLYYPDEEQPPAASQYDMYDVEKLGFLKLDILGLSTLTLIEKTLGMVPEDRRPDISDLPDRDSETGQLLAEDSLEGVFQFETAGSRELVRRMKPKSRRDLMDCIALYRPGPLQSGMTEKYILRRQGKQEVDYPHPDLEEILEDTYGLIIYQEQVMAVARKVGGFSWSRADRLRRAMSKKKEELMISLQEEFIAGATERGYEEDTARQLFQTMENFARYGFNRSHSAAYGEITYRTAYLKAHFKAAFYAALCTIKSGNTDRIARIYDAMQEDEIELALPDINRSQAEFSLSGSPVDGRVIYGLEAIKNVGYKLAETVAEERKNNGPYSSLEDFLKRIPPRYLSPKAFKSLAAAGCFDSFKQDMGYLVENARQILDAGASRYRDRQAGQERLFSDAKSGLADEEVKSWTKNQREQARKQALGYFVRTHPLHKYNDLVEFTAPGTIESYIDDRKMNYTFAPPQLLAIWVEARQGNGKKYARITGRGEELVLPLAESFRPHPGGGGAVLLELIEEEEVVVRSARRLPEEPARVGLSIFLSAHQRLDQVQEVKLALESNPGPSPVQLFYHENQQVKKLKVASKIEFNPSLARRLKNILGPDHLRLHLPEDDERLSGGEGEK